MITSKYFNISDWEQDVTGEIERQSVTCALLYHFCGRGETVVARLFIDIERPDTHTDIFADRQKHTWKLLSDAHEAMQEMKSSGHWVIQTPPVDDEPVLRKDGTPYDSDLREIKAIVEREAIETEGDQVTVAPQVVYLLALDGSRDLETIYLNMKRARNTGKGAG